jgi:O-antigen/teichoic acid export membrane protein
VKNEAVLVKSSLIFYIITYLVAPAGYFIRMIYSRTFSVEEFGLMYAIIGLFALISIFNDLGFTETLNYYGTIFFEKKKFRDLKLSFYYSIFMQLFSSILIGSLLFIFSDWLALHYFHNITAAPLIRVLVFFMVATNFSRPLVFIFLTRQDYLRARLLEPIRMYSLLLVTFFFFLFGKLTLLSAALFWVFGSVLAIIIYLFLIHKNFPEFKNIRVVFDGVLFKKLFDYALPIIIGSGATVLMSRIDVQFLTLMTDLEQVAFYETSFSIASITSFLVTPITMILFAFSVKMMVNNDTKSLGTFMSKLYSVFIFICIPLAIFIAFFAKSLLVIIFGQDYAAGHYFLWVLAFALLPSAAMGFNFSLMAGLGMVKRRNIIQFIGAFVNVIGNLVLIYFFGPIGAAFSTLFALSLIFILSYREVTTKVNISLQKYFFVKVVILNILIIPLIFVFQRLFSGSLLLMLLSLGVVFLCYIIAGWFISLWRFSNFAAYFDSADSLYAKIVLVEKRALVFFKFDK